MKSTGVKVSVENGIQVLKFNNTRTKNALPIAAYETITQSLKDAVNNPDIFCTVLTGEGDYYSSGFNITESMKRAQSSSEPTIPKELHEMIDALIDYPKLLVAIVNGPAVGIAVTTLGLCDIVYASDRATFQTPFSKLGLCAEGCASYTFPRIFGTSKANELLLTAYKMSVEEAHSYGLVSEIFKHSDLKKAWDKVLNFQDLSLNSILTTKKLVRKFNVEKLHEVNKAEITGLQSCIESEDFANNIMKFLMSKNKL